MVKKPEGMLIETTTENSLVATKVNNEENKISVKKPEDMVIDTAPKKSLVAVENEITEAERNKKTGAEKEDGER